MNYYCTLFDSFYLSRGLAMYRSLAEHSRDFHLYIFAFDDLSFKILSDSKLEYATIISLKEFESPELLAVKNTRSKGEYCWTCTPSTILYCIERYHLDHCTYVDSDLFFYADPGILIDELIRNRKSVLITDHRYSFLSGLYSRKRSGRFCVQFITFLNKPESMNILRTWNSQCLEWCYARYEPGRFGDQKYLDEWPEKYHDIHILKHQGGGVAPWNTGQYEFARNHDVAGRRKDTGEEFHVVFYHFQYVKFLQNGSVDIGWYFMSQQVKIIFYLPYLALIEDIEKQLVSEYRQYSPGITDQGKIYRKGLIRRSLKEVFCYNIINRS